jgi:hypothetical protein
MVREANRPFSQENDRVLSPDDLPTLAVFAEGMAAARSLPPRPWA